MRSTESFLIGPEVGSRKGCAGTRPSIGPWGWEGPVVDRSEASCATITPADVVPVLSDRSTNSPDPLFRDPEENNPSLSCFLSHWKSASKYPFSHFLRHDSLLGDPSWRGGNVCCPISMFKLCKFQFPEICSRDISKTRSPSINASFHLNISNQHSLSVYSPHPTGNLLKISHPKKSKRSRLSRDVYVICCSKWNNPHFPYRSWSCCAQEDKVLHSLERADRMGCPPQSGIFRRPFPPSLIPSVHFPFENQNLPSPTKFFVKKTNIPRIPVSRDFYQLRIIKIS